MTFSLETLRDCLWCQFGIAAERVYLHTLLVEDLRLTEDNVKAVVDTLTQRAGITFPVDKVQQLTDVFDLMVYVLLRSLEESEATHAGAIQTGPLAR